MTSLGNKTKGELYKEMVVTLSLTHSANVGLWVTGAPEDPLDPNGSYAINRYAIFKKLYNDNKLDNNIFENLSVEEMRFVMNNIIDDEEIMWLNDFVKVNDSTDPYRYIKYTFDYNYGKSEYYDLARKSEWDNKTRSNLTRPYLFTTKYQDANGKDYEITYGDKAKLWIVFEEGSVCGGLSKTGSNIWGSKGVPSSVIGQPGHAAYIYMALDAKGNKHWNLGNNVSGWGQSGKTEKLAVRMPNGWGTGSYIGSYPASYILLAQAALSDYDKYVASEEIIMAADVYEGNNTLLDNIYEQALKVQSINFDAWYGLVNLYIAKNASEEELLALANRIVDNLVYYPLPMHDLLRIIRDNIETEANKAVIINTITEALKRAQKTTSEEYYQASATVAVANYLLSTHKPVASFSFDGENANKIVLSDDFKNTETNWQYNLVSALPSDEANWHDATGLSHELTAEEIALIHEETDIHIRIIGANETIYDINIDKSATPLNVGSNDNENTLTGTNETMEWKLDGENTWTSFKDKEPNLEGNVSLSVRVGYTANKLASDPVTVEFTDEDSNIIKTYIKTSKLSVVDASSEETVRENNSKDNVLDGKKNTMWHTLWNGSDTEKYITLKIDEPSYITALEYVPRVNSTNGIVKEAKIEVSNDGSTWETVETTEALTWNLDNTPKMATFTKPVEATYIKLTGVKTEGNYMSASMINLFEDMTKKIPVTADIEYSTKDLTNKNVTATLTNGNRNFSVSNSNGEKSHTFTKNGNYTFEIVDDYGNTNKVTATVTWIDKDKPVGKISYSTKSKTTDKVTAILSCDEDIIITNNDGKNTYTFDKNGSFEFTYQDKAGNTNKTTAKVTWIEETKEDNITTNDNPDYNDNNYYESNNNSSNNNTYNGSYSTNQETNSNSNDNNITNNTLDNNTSTNNDDTTNSDIKNESEDNNLNENEEIKTDNDENTIIEKESNNSKNNNPVLIVTAVALISAGSITIITMIKKRK